MVSWLSSLVIAVTFTSLFTGLSARHLLQSTPATQPPVTTTFPPLPKPTMPPPMPSSLPQPTLPQPAAFPPLPSTQIPSLPNPTQPINIPNFPQISIPNFPISIPNNFPFNIPTSIPTIPFFTPPPSKLFRTCWEKVNSQLSGHSDFHGATSQVASFVRRRLLLNGRGSLQKEYYN
ncbi:hypothetical protein Bca4012_096234 [Brassica carinata]